MSTNPEPSSDFDLVVAGATASQPARGITSVCSAHPTVIRAALEQARESGAAVLIEATSNQVDQYGGYTGLTPAGFRSLVHGLGDRIGVPRGQLILGGDHLGTNRWRDLPAEQAMREAEDLVAGYVEAGFTKIHLDCSYSCADDDPTLSDETVAQRAARLLAVARDVGDAHGRLPHLRFVIGTEVPTPGGAEETLSALTPTSAESATATLDIHRREFARLGLTGLWSQVMGLVVQPGVEFDHTTVVDYRPELTKDLTAVIAAEPTMVFEAHSTDYQNPAALRALVDNHWAVLKVGPWLTFALREAYFALAAIEAETTPEHERSDLMATIERRMLAEPAHWQGYYVGDEHEQRLLRRYSYSDRMRYYWPDQQIEGAVTTLHRNLRDRPVPESLLSAYLPEQFRRVRARQLEIDPAALVVDRVRDVLRQYSAACRTDEADAA